MFWSFSAVSLFVDFQINQFPSQSETESHSFLFADFFVGLSLLRSVKIFIGPKFLSAALKKLPHLWFSFFPSVSKNKNI